jgi:hypothetical protein
MRIGNAFFLTIQSSKKVLQIVLMANYVKCWQFFLLRKIARLWEDESQNINMTAIPFLTVFHYMILLCQVPAIFCNRKNYQNMTVHNLESKCSGDAYLVIGSPDFWEMNPLTFGLPITKFASTLCLNKHPIVKKGIVDSPDRNYSSLFALMHTW